MKCITEAFLCLLFCSCLHAQEWVDDTKNDDQSQPTQSLSIATPTHRPGLSAENHTRYPLDIVWGVGKECRDRFANLTTLYNFTHVDFMCFCRKICQNKVLTPEEEEQRRRLQLELREARMRSHAVEYATIAIVLGLVSIIGFIGNVLVLVTIFVHLPRGHVTNIFISSLAVGDLLVVTICAPVRAYEYVVNRWTLGLWGCRSILYLYYVSFLLSVFTLTAMSLERYLVVCHPMRAQYVSTPGRARKIVFVIWILAILLALPILILSTLDSNQVCGLPWSDPVTVRALMVYLTAAILGCPLVLMLYAYGRTCYTLWRSLSLARGLKADGSTKRNTNDRAKEHAKKVREEKGRIQVMKMLVSILVVFVICWTPTLLYSTMVAFNNHPENRIIASRISLAFATLALANSCLNPILYAFLSSSFRRGFLKCFRVCVKRPMTREVTSYMSASTTAFTGIARDEMSGVASTRV